MLDDEIGSLSPRRAAALYESLTGQTSLKTGHVLSAATHRSDLKIIKLFFSWAVKRGYAGFNPFKDVSPVGKPRTGKLQLRIEEARRFTKTALCASRKKTNRWLWEHCSP